MSEAPNGWFLIFPIHLICATLLLLLPRKPAWHHPDGGYRSCKNNNSGRCIGYTNSFLYRHTHTRFRDAGIRDTEPGLPTWTGAKPSPVKTDGDLLP